MKLFSNIDTRFRRRNISAFTLVEMMMSVWIYLFILVGVMVAVQLFGLRVYKLAAGKITATSGGREALNQIRDDIREAKTLQVGVLKTAGDPTTFSAYGGSNLAQGEALQIYSTTNTGVPFTIYYLNTTTSNLMEYKATSTGTNTTTLDSYIINTTVFDAEDFQGNILTNNLKNNQIYGVNLQFYQLEYPIIRISTNASGDLNAFEYYQLRTKVCRRTLD